MAREVHRSSPQELRGERIQIRLMLLVLGPVIGLIAGCNAIFLPAQPTSRLEVAALLVFLLWAGFSYYVLRRAQAPRWKAALGAILSVAWAIASAVVPFWIATVLTTGWPGFTS